jgi:hypothetical protein
MNGPLQQHATRLGILCAAFIVSILVYAAVVHLVPPPQTAPFAQANPLFWVLVVVTALNVVTLTPVQRAMLAGPLRVHAVGQDLAALLRAHLASQMVLYARLEAIAVFGLVLFFVTGRSDWFWAFAAVAAAGMVLLWPTAERVRSTLGLPLERVG